MTIFLQVNNGDPSVLQSSNSDDFVVQPGQTFEFGLNCGISKRVRIAVHLVQRDSGKQHAHGRDSRFPRACYESIPILVNAIKGAIKTKTAIKVDITISADPIKLHYASP